jgi:hypothetical protein
MIREETTAFGRWKRSGSDRMETTGLSRWSFITAVAALVLLAPVFPEAESSGSGDYPYPGTGNWRITRDTSITGEKVVVQGDILVENGARLLLVDSTILMNCSSPNQYKIVVRSGCSLEMVDSTIIPVNESNGFRLVFERPAPVGQLSPESMFLLGAMVGAGVGFPLGIAATAYAYKRWFSRNLPPPV